MEWKVDLSKYCDQAIIAKGKSFYENYKVYRKTEKWTKEGTLRIQCKTADGFNFVSHPWLLVDADGEKLLDYGCDCQAARRNGKICEHCVALALECNDGILTEPARPVRSPAVWMPEETPADEEPEVTLPEEPEQVFPDVPEEPAMEEDVPEEDIPEAEDIPEEEVSEEEVSEEEPEDTEEEEKEEEGEEPVPTQQEGPRSMEILFGHELSDGAPIMWHPNDTEQVFHTNMGIIGTMGTGKTQFTKSLVTQIYREHPNNFDGHLMGILIFDYKGDYNETKEDFVRATNAKIYKPYRLPYNPLALNQAKSFKPLLPLHTANEFKDTICRIYKDLGPKQQQVLLDCIVKAYAKQGIDPARAETWNRPAPTFDQVYQVFAEETAGRPVDSLYAAMNKIYQFCLFEPNPRRAMPLEKMLRGVVVVDLSGYDRDIQSLIVAITLDQFYAQMQKFGSSKTDGRYRQLRNLILVDEADSFMAQGFPSLRRIMKEGREFGVGVVLSTQSLTHFVGGDDDYSRYVLTWVVHNVSDLKQRDTEYVFKLQPKSPEIVRYYATIKGLKKHESVVKLSNGLPIVIRDRAFWQLWKEMSE